MNADTKLCAICLAAGIQVVASKVNECGDVCEFCFKGELHPAIKAKDVSIARSPVKAARADRRTLRWDALVFDKLRENPDEAIVLTFPNRGKAHAATVVIRSRRVPGLVVSQLQCVVRVRLEREGGKVERRGGVRFERREASL